MIDSGIIASDKAAAGIRELLNPKSIAVVGASRRAGTVGACLIENLKRDGFQGPIFPINPAAGEILGLRAFPTVQAVNAAIDLAVIAVPAAAVEAAVDDCIAAGVRALVVITSGFAEVSEAGREAEQRILQKVRAAGIRMVGPNCMGVINTDPNVQMNTTFTPTAPPRGNIGILTQSGALGLAILNHVRDLKLGVSTFVSVGNKADVSGNDLLTYWADDPRTGVIVLYLESFGNPRKFARIASEVVRRTPIVAVKSGRSAAGKRAATSHSASLASLDVAVDALFEQVGVIRTDTLEELFDVAALLATQPVPVGPRVGVVTNAGGPGILFADACEARGLSLPELSPETIRELRTLLPPHAGLANPIDLVGSDIPEDFAHALELVGRDPNVDSLVAMFITPLATTRPEAVARSIAEAAGRIPEHKPMLAVFLSAHGTPDMPGMGGRGRIPTYIFPESAALALSEAYHYSRWRRRPVGRPLQLPADAIAAARNVIEPLVAASQSPQWLEASAMAAVLDAVRVPFAAPTLVTVDDAARVADRIGYPLVAKAVAPGVLHKSDVGGVILGLTSAVDVSAAVERLQFNMRRIGARLDGILLQRQFKDGIEALIGMTSDPVFGPLLVCGLGGVQVELIKDVSFRLTPVTDLDADEMLEKLKMSPLLDGYRGAPPGDRAALRDAILRISALVDAVPEILELDLNPVKVLLPGDGVIVVDARMRVGRPDARRRESPLLRGPRRMAPTRSD